MTLQMSQLSNPNPSSCVSYYYHINSVWYSVAMLDQCVLFMTQCPTLVGAVYVTNVSHTLNSLTNLVNQSEVVETTHHPASITGLQSALKFQQNRQRHMSFPLCSQFHHMSHHTWLLEADDPVQFHDQNQLKFGISAPHPQMAGSAIVVLLKVIY